ncbi:MAG TPA: hypothetical protein VMT30_09260 [Candidatus Saccharimonadia bacterium]|nr:hypothetical protein [Candidatus Saccharimonadia bacterium]
MTASPRATDDGPDGVLAAELNRESPLVDLFRQIREVFAVETPCPGDHSRDGRFIDRDDIFDELMTKHGLPDDWNHERLYRENTDLWRKIYDEMDAVWVKRSECKLTIPVYEEWDGDGEYRSWCYPVADGPCADALSLNENEWQGEFWAAHFTQERLRKDVEKILTGQEALTLDAATAPDCAGDGG